MKDEITYAVENALDAMKAAGCFGCSNFPRCRASLGALAGAARASVPVERPATTRLGNWFRRLFTWAAFAVSFNLAADVYCTWNGNGYVCSGSGDNVWIGPSVVGDSYYDVATNVYGQCTNCLHMSVEEMITFKGQAQMLLFHINSNLGMIRATAQQESQTIGQEWTYIENAPYLVYDETTFRNGAIMTNFIFSIAVPYGGHFLSAADSVVPHSSAGQTTVNRVWVSAWDGAVEYGKQVQPVLYQANNALATIDNEAAEAQLRMSQLTGLVSDLPEEPCCENVTNDLGQVTNGCNNVYQGRWCTEEQGDAIIRLLGEIDTWTERNFYQLTNISASVKRIQSTLDSVYFHSAGVPADTDWAFTYFAQEQTDWYNPSNVLERIELLLYGMVGGSNSVAAVAGDPDDVDPDELRSALDDLATDAEDAEQPIRSFGTSLLHFFQALSLDDDQLRLNEQLTDDVSLRLNGRDYTVPGLVSTDNQDTLDNWKLFVQFARAFCQCFYGIVSAFAVFYWWVWFSQKAATFIKWAQELLSGLFSS